MKKEEFLKLLQARLIERGVPEDTALKETEHVRTYLSESGMEDLDISIDEMADGIIAMLDDTSEDPDGKTSPAVPVILSADDGSESVSDELSAAIAAMDTSPKKGSAPVEEEPMTEEAHEPEEESAAPIPIVLESSSEAEEDPLTVSEPETSEESAPEVIEDPAEPAEPTEETITESATDNPNAPDPEPQHRVAPADISEEDADIEEFIPYGKKSKMKKIDKQQKSDNAWLYVMLLVITLPIAVALILIAFTLYLGFWVVLALAMIACIAVLIVFVTVFSIVSIVGIVYGVVQLITGLVPVGLFEIGLGIIIGAAVMFIGILVYNFAVRFIPFGMKLLAKLFRAGFRGIKNGYQLLKGAVADL